MGTAFSSSLLGLAGSLVVGLLELFAGHGQNRFYRELEEWMSTITRVGIDGDDSAGTGGAATTAMVEQMGEVMDTIQLLLAQNEADRAATDNRFQALAEAITTLMQVATTQDTSAYLARVADGQSALIQKLDDSGMDGIDAESRMRLRSIDVQLLRILEELSAGRQESIGALRRDLATLASAIRDRG